MTKPSPVRADLPSGGVCTLRSSSGVRDSATRITTIELRLYLERPLADIVIAGDPLSWYLHGPMFAPLFAIDVDTGLRRATQPLPGSEWEAVLFEQATVNGAVLTNHFNFKSRSLGDDADGGHQFARGCLKTLLSKTS